MTSVPVVAEGKQEQQDCGGEYWRIGKVAGGDILRKISDADHDIQQGQFARHHYFLVLYVGVDVSGLTHYYIPYTLPAKPPHHKKYTCSQNERFDHDSIAVFQESMHACMVFTENA